MGDKVYLRQKWTRYLGELRPIHDIDVFFVPSTPSPTPSLTPTLTPTITPTKTITPTVTNTPSVTPTLSLGACRTYYAEKKSTFLIMSTISWDDCFGNPQSQDLYNPPGIGEIENITFCGRAGSLSFSSSEIDLTDQGLCIPPTPSITATITKTPVITPTLSPTITPTKTITPSVTITNTLTPTITPTSSCSPFTTQYMKSEQQGNSQIKFSVFTDAGYTNNTNAVCDYAITGTYNIQNGATNVPYSTTMANGDHTHTYNTGNNITGFTITSVVPACVCVNIIDNIVTPTPTPSVTQTLTPSITPSLTPTNTITPSITPTISVTPSITPSLTPTLTPTMTSTITPTLTPTITVTPSNTPICNNLILGFDYINPAFNGNMIGYSTDGILISGASPNPSTYIVGGNPAGITSVATSGSKWVAVGSNGAVTPNAISLGLYSDNGISWYLSDLATVRTNANNPIEDVIWDGNRFLGIGASTTPLVQSTNGSAWSAITGSNISLSSSLPAFREAFIYYDNTNYWAGGNPSFYKSTNGNVYTAQTMSGINRFYDMLYTQSKWILAGRDSTTNTGIIQVSNDGSTWTAQTIPSCTDVYCLTTNGNIILAGAEGSNKLLYSYDGLNWSAQSISGIFTTRIFDFTYNGTLFVGAGEGTKTVGYSYDGLNWTASTIAQQVNRCNAVASIPDSIVYPNIAENCPTPSPTKSSTPTLTPTQTITPSIGLSTTPTPSVTQTLTPSVSPTQTLTPSITPTKTITPTITSTMTPTPSIPDNCCYLSVGNTSLDINIVDVKVSGVSVSYLSGQNFTIFPADPTGYFYTFQTGSSVTVDIYFNSSISGQNITLQDCAESIQCYDTTGSGGIATFTGVNLSCGCSWTINASDGACV